MSKKPTTKKPSSATVRMRHHWLEILVYHHDDDHNARWTTRYDGSAMKPRDAVRLCALAGRNYPVRKMESREVSDEHAEVGAIVYNHKIRISALDRKVFSTLPDAMTTILLGAVYQSLLVAADAETGAPPTPAAPTPPPASAA